MLRQVNPLSPPPAPVGIAIIDQIPLFREALAARVLRDPRLRLIGATGHQHAAVLMRHRQGLDVLIVDAALDQRGQLTRLFTHARGGAAVLVLVREPWNTADYLRTMLAAGAAGVLCRDAEPDRLLAAVGRTHAGQPHAGQPHAGPSDGGQSYVDPALARLLAGEPPGPRSESPLAEFRLSRREYQVLQLVADGLSNRDIAAELFLSVETVRTHTKGILRRLDARDRAHAVALGFERGLLAGSGASGRQRRGPRLLAG
ncbi:MAG TPA: response regulator transcription factor [Pseudonocardiaceae bacterium]|jgi:DNA-binding NarL/FixJ family response regulator|nr:response regulator transcription factor [Pseudonocardiaceae bacterium]